MKKRFAILTVIVAAVSGAAYFLFPALPAGTKEAFRDTAAIAAKSWDDAFGFSSREYVIAAGDGADVFPEEAVPDPAASESASGTPSAPADAPSEGPLPDIAIAKASDGAEVPAGVPTGTPADAPVAPIPAPPVVPCDISRAVSAVPSRRVILNEIAWMGSPPVDGETASAAGNREWIEVKNVSAGAIDLLGWQLRDAAGNIKVILEESVNIPAQGFYLFTRGDRYSGALPNGGAQLFLFDPSCGLSDRIDAKDGWPAGDNASKKTLERNADGYGWHTSVPPGGTPGAENSIPPVVMAWTPPAPPPSVPPPSSVAIPAPEADAAASTTGAGTAIDCATSTLVDHLVIAAIQIAGASSTDDFIRIFNPTTAAIDIGGWKLRKKTKTGTDYSVRVFPDGSSVPSGGYFIWANGEGGFGASIGADATSTQALSSDNSAALFEPDGALVDAVAWGEGADQYKEGTAYAANPEPGRVLKRRFWGGAVVDSDNNARDFTI